MTDKDNSHTTEVVKFLEGIFGDKFDRFLQRKKEEGLLAEVDSGDYSTLYVEGKPTHYYYGKLFILKKNILDLLKQDKVLNDFIDDILELEVKFSGGELFQNVYIDEIVMKISTKEYGFIKLKGDELYEIVNYMCALWVNRKVLLHIYNEIALEDYIEETNNYIFKLDSNDTINNMVMDFYLDHLHDFVSLEPKNIIYKSV